MRILFSSLHVVGRRQDHRFLVCVLSFSSCCPFQVLGISNKSSYEEVKRAFVKLALEHHPDTSRASSPSVDRFTEIREAFESIQDVNGQAVILAHMERHKWNHETLHDWFRRETGQNLSFRMDAATRRQVAAAASMSPGGLDRGGMWELARKIAREEKESPVKDDPLQIEGGSYQRSRRRKK